MSKLHFKMDDFGIHESISYELRDRLAKHIQHKFDKWYDENHKNRRIGPYKIAPFGEQDYAIYLDGDKRVTLSKQRLENIVADLYNELYTAQHAKDEKLDETVS